MPVDFWSKNRRAFDVRIVLLGMFYYSYIATKAETIRSAANPDISSN